MLCLQRNGLIYINRKYTWRSYTNHEDVKFIERERERERDREMREIEREREKIKERDRHTEG